MKCYVPAKIEMQVKDYVKAYLQIDKQIILNDVNDCKNRTFEIIPVNPGDIIEFGKNNAYRACVFEFIKHKKNNNIILNT